VLYCGTSHDSRALAGAAARLRGAGIGLTGLENCAAPPACYLPTPSHASGVKVSDRIRHALELLHSTHRFSLVEFADWQGFGFRSIQAKRAGLAFGDVPFLVTLHGSSQWRREAGHHYLSGPDELELDYAERYAFENADFQAGINGELLDHARRVGWRVRDDARVISNGDADSNLGHVYGAMLPNRSSACPECSRSTPLVTVAIPYFNLGPYLPAALASLATQTYSSLDVIIIDDGSTDSESIRVFEEQRRLYPQFRFLSQENAGIGAARNRGLQEARGEFFIPMDADNVAFRHMVERLVRGIERNPDLAAMTCYFVAFQDDGDLERGQYLYATRPTGGPRVMASFQNVYGDANAIFRTAVFRKIGGYETDRDTSFEDWEAFVKLVNAGHQIDVVPDYLFAYRHREGGFSRVTGAFPNHQRVLRQVIRAEGLPLAEKVALWGALIGLQKHAAELSQDNRALRTRLSAWRYRLADKLAALLGRIPLARRALKGLFRSTTSAWKYITRRAG
jgi:glycosyltransferase involved in cell wall biosynthesis